MIQRPFEKTRYRKKKKKYICYFSEIYYNYSRFAVRKRHMAASENGSLYFNEKFVAVDIKNTVVNI